MIIGNTPVYIIRYPYGGNIDLDTVVQIVEAITKKVRANDPTADVLALPNDITLQKMGLPDLQNLHAWLGDYITNHNFQEEEET